MVLVSCGTARILGLSRGQAAQNLGNGDVDFILEAELPGRASAALARLRPLARVREDAAFYAAVLTGAAGGQADSARKSALLFTLALESPSPVIRRESAQKLITPVLAGGADFAREVLAVPVNRTANDEAITLGSACLYRLGRFNEVIRGLESHWEKSSWNTALYLLSLWREARHKGEPDAAAKAGRAGVRFFLSAPVDAAWNWAYAEFSGVFASKGGTAAGGGAVSSGGEDCFSPAEWAAFSVRAEVAHSRFSRGIDRFRESDAGLFLANPELVTDLGRAFQFTPDSLGEGAELFALWEEQIAQENPGADPVLNFLLPYFAGRMRRQAGEPAESNEAFLRALKAAPDPARADACIWYILTNSFTQKPETSLPQFKFFIPLMNTLSYFDDILDRLSQFLLTQRNWKGIEEIFALLRNRKDSTAYARFAWILGRAREENLYRPELEADFFRLIYDDETAPLYYRAMSARTLGLPLIPEARPAAAHTTSPGPEAEFLLGFFDYDAAGLAVDFIARYEDSLSVPELRLIAAALANAGRTGESISLVSRYTDRAGFTIEREDLGLLYPRPYLELIERYAGETGVKPEVLFALIRTESYFMSGVESHAGAAGLTQLMSPTALDMAGRIARAADGTARDYRTGDGIDLKDPETNVHIGSFYLNYLTELFESPIIALVAYNGGLGRARRWQNAAPDLPNDLFLEAVEFPETREYGRRVTAAAAIYGYLYYGMKMDDVIADIYR